LYPQPPENILEKYYAGSYWREPKKSKFNIEDFIIEKLFFSELLIIKKNLPKLSKNKEKLKILDIGCGTGDFVMLLNKIGFDAYGIDSFYKDLNKIDGFLKNKIKLASITDDYLPFEKSTFDAVVLLHTLEHINSQEKALKNIYSILKPSGILIVQVPNFNSFLSKIFKLKWVGIQFPMHLYHFTPQSLIKLVNKFDFDIIHLKHFSLRSNPAQWVCTLFPFLDPNNIRHEAKNSFESILMKFFYMIALLIMLPFAVFESLLSHGNSITIVAKKKSNV
jgi:ubiquinone/menaquinone biosynthesis C-methylase UbiE